ncbi:hypothetical protein DYE48_18105 [Halobacillus trueperi]|uniref:Uncharacterized protein n=1 Tax=Halobacillus trueperi TaxID=156205 RepID=A0A3E0J1P1_9BACI|nr:hypothetical protein DYE48_18105 [Halobacillus trueperi]
MFSPLSLYSCYVNSLILGKASWSVNECKKMLVLKQDSLSQEKKENKIESDAYTQKHQSLCVERVDNVP